jgi:hypothetical protein
MGQDFERKWLAKLSDALDETAGEALRREIMLGSESLSASTGPDHVAAWTRDLMGRMTARLEPGTARTAMTRCACQYSKSALQPLREEYARSRDVGIVHGMLQERFESFIRDSLQLPRELADKVIGQGWGAAGQLAGSSIIATKIPKSGDLQRYFEETDPSLKRQLYCHCPRIRHILKISERFPALYCYCGAGFYRGIWEEILQEPVEVEVLETVLDGGEVCRIAVHLPLEP